ncbi:helix-turn-helix transcriptional regulator [Marinomonas transparens]|uniref:HTH luxR-type domain-containing protein n=1 Tax=Marinomonas transparens TaxID=2795388 RepID=A0A934JWV5_9GAMM|nr:hypothetical protein [Marinomonas transparens]MBJ7539856.1 hypothetical protein [Marinomonas transparens]
MSAENITFYPAKNATLNITQLAPLALFAHGLPVKTISHRLNKADPTINHHLTAAREHYGARNTIHAVAIAIARGDIKHKIESTYTITLRTSAFAFALLAGLVGIQDVIYSADQDLARYSRSAHRSARQTHTRTNKPLDLIV